MGKLLLRAIWNPRPSTAEDGVAQLVEILQAVAVEHAGFSEWFQLGRSRKDALSKPVRIENQSIRQTLSRNHTDFGHEVIEELGWSWWVWNGGRGGVDLQCNCTFGATAPRSSNRFLLGLPHEFRDSDEIQDRLLAAAMSVWKPDDLSIWSGGEPLRRLGGSPT